MADGYRWVGEQLPQTAGNLKWGDPGSDQNLFLIDYMNWLSTVPLGEKKKLEKGKGEDKTPKLSPEKYKYDTFAGDTSKQQQRDDMLYNLMRYMQMYQPPLSGVNRSLSEADKTIGG